jgi:hypothetical protein
MSNIPAPGLQKKTADGRSWRDILAWITGGYWIDDEHVVHGPNLKYRPVMPEAATQPIIRPRSAILHTNAGGSSAASLWYWMTRADVTGEPHFQVGYAGVEQNMPLNRRADCNYSANRWLENGTYWGAISFETQDDGAATVERTPWSVAQLRAMVNILTCLCVVYGITCNQPVSWNASGIGHHSLFPFQGVLSKAWTNVRGKTCPGAARKTQMDWIRAEVAKNLAAFGQETGWRCGTAA